MVDPFSVAFFNSALFGVYFLSTIVCGFIGIAIDSTSPVRGFWIGLLFGPIGLIIVAILRVNDTVAQAKLTELPQPIVDKNIHQAELEKAEAQEQARIVSKFAQDIQSDNNRLIKAQRDEITALKRKATLLSIKDRHAFKKSLPGLFTFLLIGFAFGSLIVYTACPRTLTKEITITVDKPVEVPIYKDVIKEIPVTVTVVKEIPKIEYVDKPSIKYIDRVKEVPKIEYVDRIREVPTIVRPPAIIKYQRVRWNNVINRWENIGEATEDPVSQLPKPNLIERE